MINASRDKIKAHVNCCVTDNVKGASLFFVVTFYCQCNTNTYIMRHSVVIVY